MLLIAFPNANIDSEFEFSYQLVATIVSPLPNEEEVSLSESTSEEIIDEEL